MRSDDEVALRSLQRYFKAHYAQPRIRARHLRKTGCRLSAQDWVSLDTGSVNTFWPFLGPHRTRVRPSRSPA